MDAGGDVVAAPEDDVRPEALAHPADPVVRERRRPIPFWDRTKLLLLLTVLFGLFVWNDVSSNPILPVEDALDRQVEARWWVFALFGLELVRQVHYVLSERWAGWHHLWAHRVFGGVARRTGRLSDWTRYRLGRVLRVVAALVLLDLLLASLFDIPPANALVEAPSRLWQFLPLALQLLFGFFFVIVQFVGLFWFLSRGGVDTYMPDEIQTRFTDVWGQDNVVEKVKENIVFLEEPERIEEKGGFVPSGILLWGPPGTGKTLMAEAVAGETGKPYVFVDPGAFIQMFMGVGILKVKSLFRKLRKLALRYGGVVVFFDEADSLGSRGALAPGFGGGHGALPAPSLFAPNPPCNGASYLSPETASAVYRDQIVMGGFGFMPSSRPSTASS